MELRTQDNASASDVVADARSIASFMKENDRLNAAVCHASGLVNRFTRLVRCVPIRCR